MSDQPVTETSTYTGQHNRQTSMPRAGFEPATPTTKRPQTYVDRVATGIGSLLVFILIVAYLLPLSYPLLCSAPFGYSTTKIMRAFLVSLMLLFLS
jgi:hypothetical protein